MVYGCAVGKSAVVKLQNIYILQKKKTQKTIARFESKIDYFLLT